MNWNPISTAPLGVVVVTKIDDASGPRNEQLLIQKQRGPEFRPMWWFPDMSMYVYYTPTHWRPSKVDA
ncbi:hypothetical protein [Stenotrophomonas sp. BIGb0135]|uniref:hypothetical protein n=1 Tax=Stenotrophomonas sp. BIGb0135 TaxID=2940620 RepID=UPI00216A3F26|nr:hypothetical protein [Stenotrophomonas sp. BIGb0135]MCS4234453.1 hypothetical protein [Stenotrophomonas sp. BIGb0135]